MPDIDFHKRNFFNTDVADIYRALDGRSHIGAFILTFCLIDHLSWLEFGFSNNQEKNFIKWVEKRLEPQYIFYKGKAEELYSVRCALVHTYGPSQAMIKSKFDGYQLNVEYVGMHMQKVNNNILRLCLYSLLTETIYSAHLFFEELKESKFFGSIERLEKQIKIMGIEPPRYYKDMHRALAIFDSEESISLNSIRAEYTEKILYA